MLDAQLASLYPAVSNHLESIEALRGPDAIFLGVQSEDELIACGAALLRLDDANPEVALRYGEIKRVFVLPAHRGKGHARRIMQALEDQLRERGAQLARLETGISQPEALRLYRELGYAERGPFGSYAVDPLSVFMEKSLR